jgi:TP901 family phage tail tape measure protein
MAVRTEELQLRVVIDGSPARRELAQLDQEYAQIKASMRDLKKGTDEWVAASARLDQIGARQAELRKEIGLTGLTAKQLGDELKRLQVQQRNLTPNTAQWAETTQRIEQVKARLRELNDVNARSAAAWEVQRKAIRLTDMTMEELEMESRRLMAQLRTMNPNSAEFGRLARELRNVDSRMQTLRAGMTPFNRMWQEVKTNLVSAGAVLAGVFAGSVITQWVGGMVKGAAELSDLQADIQRTTGLNKEAARGLMDELGRFNTRTPRAELLKLAADAGKLGITGVEDIKRFVRAGDQIRVALGEDLGEEAIKQIGKLNQTFQLGETRGLNMEQQMLSTGSAINALGQASTAQERYLVDFTRRLAGVATQSDISIENVLGFGAALDQLGQTSETSSTAVSQFILKAFKDTADYARIANMEQAEFAKLLKTDTNEALLRVLEGLNGNNEGLQAMVQKFGLVDQEGARAVGVLSSLARNTKLVREQQAIANTEFAKATSITNEFNTKNNTLAGNLEVVGKRLKAFFVSSTLVEGLNKMAKALRDMVSPTISEGLERERIEMLALHTQILEANTSAETRVRLIRELQEKYPEYLGNLDAETVSNEELTAAIGKLNQQLVNRIILQREQEKIESQAEDIASAATEKAEREVELRQLLGKLAAERNITLKEGLTLQEQAERVIRKVKAQEEAAGKVPGPYYLRDSQKLTRALRDYIFLSSELNRQTNLGAQLEEKRNELLKTLGITLDDLNKPRDTSGGGDAGGDEDQPVSAAAALPNPADDKALEKQRQQMQAWEAELEAFRERVLQAGMSADEAELRQLDQKHAEERAKLNANAKATAEDLLDQEILLAKERADLIEAQGNRRLEAYQEAERTINEALRAGASERLKDEVAIWDARIERARASGADVTALERERAVALLAVLEDEYRQRLAAEIAHWDRLIEVAKKAGIDTAALEEAKGRAINAITKKWEEKGVQDTEDAEMRKRAARVKSLQDYGQVANSFGNVLDSLAALQQAKHDEDGVRTEEEKRNQRDLALLIIAVKTAAAIATGVAQAMELPYPANIAAALSTVATVTGLIAQAQALMNDAGSSTPPPAATTTTVNNMPLAEKGGVFDGPSHDRGGLQVWDPVAGRQVAEVEGGEPWMVLSKAFRRNNAALIPVLLQASATGAKVPMGAAGGVFAPGPAFNFRQASQAVKMAAGGLTTRGVAMVNVAGPGGGGAPGWAQALIEEMRGLRALAQRPVEVHNALQVDARVKLGQDYDREQAKWAQLKARNTIPKK